MKSYSFTEIMEISSGRLIKGSLEGSVDAVTIDSRKCDENSLYIPIVGDNNNGHDFIASAGKNGAKITLTQEVNREFPEQMTVILVESTFKALQILSKYNRNRYDIPVIAITGSSGKTTTKDLLASVLGQKFKTLKTQGNFNNEYGIPQTLLQLDESHQMAVIEMGMDHLGDIEKSIGLVRPDISVITNVGLTHIEILKTRENIFRAKKEILTTLGAKDIALVNGDDDCLKTLADEKHPYCLKSFGMTEDSDLYVSCWQADAAGLQMKMVSDEESETYTFKIPGEHNVYNCLVAVFLGKHFGLSKAEIQAGLDAFEPSANRMDIFEFQEMMVINDSYNANPDAMRGALDVLDTYSGGRKRRVAVLGDMLEMGEYGPPEHLKIGQYARDKADILITVGDLSQKIAEGFNHQGMAYHFNKVEDAIEPFLKLIKKDDVILIKASRGIHLERLVVAIKEGK
ncbi:UDP-N-acetylmuramoyl-tripeptide--D-alanyl-D-alanine ligase [Eubacteriaceae bacterium ES3]|nr:UDP-N-acetylmuramoyl-tripeptide--D-alanyl-D-alanine ligase [Eubacteriaceae bacterium ES3]